MTISTTAVFDELGQAQLGTSATIIFTVSSSQNWIAKDIILCNTTSGDVTVSLYRVANGGTASKANALVDTRTIPAYDLIQIIGEKGMLVGVTMQGLCSVADAITATISGVKFS